MSNSSSVTTAQASSQQQLPGWVLPALVVAGLAAAFVGELVIDANKERFYTPEPGLPPFPPEFIRERMWNNIFNHSICYGFLGLICVSLVNLVIGGLAGATRSFWGFLLGSTSGLVFGVATGVGGYFISTTLQQIDIEGVLKAMAIFLPFWFVTMLLSGLIALHLIGMLRKPGNAITFALLFSILACVAYPIFVSVAFPTEWPGIIIPEFKTSRLSCYIIGAVCNSVCAWFVVKSALKISAAEQLKSSVQ
ncbi:MAG: hypothetical protein KDB03_16945 [Planctomycetales bacterium]|nr:hypothetical protein [Planctomycetales bacterium]